VTPVHSALLRLNGGVSDSCLEDVSVLWDLPWQHVCACHFLLTVFVVLWMVFLLQASCKENSVH
jgi:hypothetical protein